MNENNHGVGRFKIGIIDADSHNFPNLALMKLSAWHKARGDTVEWWWGFGEYDRVYMSKVFDETYSPDVPEPLNALEIVKGGTGYGLDNRLPDEVEHIYPDYSLYPELTKETAYGFLTRGCGRGCSFCCVSRKEGRASRKMSDLSEWWSGQKYIKLLDPNLLACREHMDLLDQLAESGAWADFTQGLDCRLLTEENIAAINAVKLKGIHFAWDFMRESDAVLRGLRLYAKRAVRKPHGKYATVYVLTNYDTTMEENLYRIYTLRDMGYDPYVMIYNKPNAPPPAAKPHGVRALQRWCNNRLIFRSVPDFYQYDPKRQGAAHRVDSRTKEKTDYEASAVLGDRV